MLATLRGLGSQREDYRASGPACFGRAMGCLLPEDEFDHQPLIGGGGRFLLVADARVDNRSEIGVRLGCTDAHLRMLSDADVLLAAWERWGLRSLDHVLGDIALAVWDVERAELTLARTPLSLNPLFHDDRADQIAFATMPSALLTLEGNTRRLNCELAASFASGNAYVPGSAAMFEGVRAVPQGHAVVFRNGTRRSVRLWELDAEPLKISVGEAGEALRAELDRAVAARLRRLGGRAACQLSAGRDSGAVAASAALQLGRSGEQLLAFTSAPRAGFAIDAAERWLSDESPIAMRAADRGGMDHGICRPDRSSFTQLLDRHTALHFDPVVNPANLPWLDQISRHAAARGASVLLVGAAGNFTISAGGTAILPDYFAERGFLPWWGLARGLAGASPARWRHMANFTFAPFVPRAAYATMTTLMGRRAASTYDLPLLKGSLRARAETMRREAFRDERPAGSYRAFLRSMLLSIDYGEKSNLMMWGVDVRDPTADRRLAELCLSLPVEAYVAPGQARPAYAAAFAERLIPEVVEATRPGFQAADWFEFIDPADLLSAADRYFRNPIVESSFDRDAIAARIASWPVRGGHDRQAIEHHYNQLLGTLSLASFIAVNFPDG